MTDAIESLQFVAIFSDDPLLRSGKISAEDAIETAILRFLADGENESEFDDRSRLGESLEGPLA